LFYAAVHGAFIVRRQVAFIAVSHLEYAGPDQRLLVVLGWASYGEFVVVLH
jgi:hypothetical protein